jgi:diguanylate cyclase (GGDEF)-like protein
MRLLPRFDPALERLYLERRQRGLELVARVFLPVSIANLALFGLWDYFMQPDNLAFTLAARGLGILAILGFWWLYRRGVLLVASCLHLTLGVGFVCVLAVLTGLENGLLLGVPYLMVILLAHNAVMVRLRDFWVVILEVVLTLVVASQLQAPASAFANAVIALSWAAGVMVVFYFLLDSFHRRSFLVEQRFEHQARTDDLTGIFNRRTFSETGRSELERSLRYDSPLSLLILDIDRFKTINDTYGHDVGDRVIVAVASACRGFIRQSDSVGRMGGEEFGVLLPETGLEQAHAMAERLRQTLQELRVSIPQGEVRFTVSIGVATLVKGQSWNDLLKAADVALYAAKNGGRNRVVAGEKGLGLRV